MKGLSNKMYTCNVRCIYATLFFLSIFSVQGLAQHKQADSSGYYRNNIKINISNWILYNNVYMLSYERNVSAHQTFSVTGGYVEMPVLMPQNSSAKAAKSLSKSGFTIGGDYRFYFPRENKYPAPHGVYIGPYFSYYSFKNNRDVQYTDAAGGVSTGNLHTNMNIANLGVQFGYQFVINKRFSIDLTLLAPSLSRYKIKMDATGNLSDNAKEIIYSDVVQSFINRFPILDKLITDSHVDISGSRNVLAPGLKYCVYIGYSFGRK